jgi:uncharacterized protein (TIGR02300 family)
MAICAHSCALPLTGAEDADYAMCNKGAVTVKAPRYSQGSLNIMSMKAERGTKRVCQSCGSKFYDLHRDPITCPVCQSVYQLSATAVRPAAAGNNLDADDDAVLDAGRSGLEFVPLDEVAANEGEDLPDIEGEDIADVNEEEDAGLEGGEDETFLEAEDEGESDMSGYVGGAKDEEV